jgi:hypothetical protein
LTHNFGKTVGIHRFLRKIKAAISSRGPRSTSSIGLDAPEGADDEPRDEGGT